MLAEVQRRTADSMNRSADNFERYEAATNLHVPPELYLQQVSLSISQQQFAQAVSAWCCAQYQTAAATQALWQGGMQCPVGAAARSSR